MFVTVILIVSINFFYYFNLIIFIDFKNGIPIIPYNQKSPCEKNDTVINNNIKNTLNNIDIKPDLKEQEKNQKMTPAILVPAPIFFNPMIKNSKGIYNKYQKKKSRPFTERQGDWICKFCKNLNFAFRNECNRCKIPIKDCLEIIKQGDDNDIYNKNKMNNKKGYKYKKNQSNQFNERDFAQNQKINDYKFAQNNNKSLDE